jgi:hypothetical protein
MDGLRHGTKRAVGPETLSGIVLGARLLEDPGARFAPLNMRLLYLHRDPRAAGRGAIGSRRLLDRLREQSEDVLIAYAVWGKDEPDQQVPDRYPDDVLREQPFWLWDPDVIIIEGGPFHPGTPLRWRVPKPALERFCAAGGVLIILDADYGLVVAQQELFRAIVDGRLVAIPFAGPISWVEGRAGPVHGFDLEHTAGPSDRTIVCRPELMVIADWLKPASTAWPRSSRITRSS